MGIKNFFKKASTSVKILLFVVVAVVIYYVIKFVMNFLKDPLKYFLDAGDYIFNEIGKLLKSCGSCNPTDAQKAKKPPETSKTLCPGTGMPFLNLSCGVGIIIVAGIVGGLLAAGLKLYRYVNLKSGKGELKASEIDKEVTEKPFSDFEDRLRTIETEYDDAVDKAYEDWKIKRSADGKSTDRKSFNDSVKEKFAAANS
jgi:hypothetical protein